MSEKRFKYLEVEGEGIMIAKRGDYHVPIYKKLNEKLRIVRTQISAEEMQPIPNIKKLKELRKEEEDYIRQLNRSEREKHSQANATYIAKINQK